MCIYFDPDVARTCREDDAEEVKEKERANFCDYFQLSESAFDAGAASADTQARGQLDELFGEDGGGPDDEPGSDPGAAKDLFK
jgi:hypothetical protein